LHNELFAHQKDENQSRGRVRRLVQENAAKNPRSTDEYAFGWYTVCDFPS
jgi:hypothetical protein